MKCGVACSHTPGLISILDSSCPDICPNSETFILYEIRAGIKESMKFELILLPLSVVREGFLVDGMPVGQVLLCSLFSVSVLILPLLHIYLAPGTTTVNIVVTVAPVQGTQPHHIPWTKRKEILFWILFWLVLLCCSIWGLCAVGLLSAEYK